MNKIERSELKQDIKKISLENFEQTFYIFYYYIETLLYSLMTFGLNNKIMTEINCIWYDFLNNQRMEKRIHQLILKKMKYLDITAINDFLDKLDFLNEQSIEYLYNCLDEMADACEMHNVYRAKRIPHDFAMLSESEKYKNELAEILIAEKDIIHFLGLSKEFGDYLNLVDERIIYIDHNFEDDRDFYGVNYKLDNEGKISDLKLFIPIVINLETALIFTELVNNAQELYNYIGKTITDEEIEAIQKNPKRKQLILKNDFKRNKKHCY